ncbi:MAG: Rossmann-like and DUF2520 domain-containing protein [Mangrovibacterium sp.]
MMIRTITLIGAGNLATQTGKALKKAGLEIRQVYSRTEQSARELADLLTTTFTHKTEEIDLSADLVLVAVKDDAIEEVLACLDCRQTLLAHTAGSVPMQLLEKHTNRFGVFYPLQTFSKKRDVDFSEIPICLEANSAETMNELKELAFRISGQVLEIDSAKRKILHLAAVFSCNFVNHFYYLGDLLLEQHQLNFDLLKPLIRETAGKVMELRPFDAQTGPAKRFDETIINNHLSLLGNQPELAEIYNFVSGSIFQAHKNS